MSAPRAHESSAFARADLDVDRRCGGRGGDGATRPDVIVNCAGVQRRRRRRGSSGRRAERQRVRRARAGARGRAHGAILVHYSTDFVFDGTGAAPYTEEDRAESASVYAASKLLGEWFAADAPRAYVLRVESLFGQAPGGPEPQGSVGGICGRCSPAARSRGFRGPHDVAHVHHRRCAGDAQLLERGAPSGPVSLRQFRRTRGSSSRSELARQPRTSRRTDAGAPADVTAARGAAAVLRAVEREAAAASGSTCRPGRTRCGASSRRARRAGTERRAEGNYLGPM